MRGAIFVPRPSFENGCRGDGPQICLRMKAVQWHTDTLAVFAPPAASTAPWRRIGPWRTKNGVVASHTPLGCSQSERPTPCPTAQSNPQHKLNWEWKEEITPREEREEIRPPLSFYCIQMCRIRVCAWESTMKDTSLLHCTATGDSFRTSSWIQLVVSKDNINLEGHFRVFVFISYPNLNGWPPHSWWCLLSLGGQSLSIHFFVPPLNHSPCFQSTAWSFQRSVCLRD